MSRLLKAEEKLYTIEELDNISPLLGDNAIDNIYNSPVYKEIVYKEVDDFLNKQLQAYMNDIKYFNWEYKGDYIDFEVEGKAKEEVLDLLDDLEDYIIDMIIENPNEADLFNRSLFDINGNLVKIV